MTKSYANLSKDTWENLFLAYYTRNGSKHRSATIVIDGLDEATKSTQRTLMGFLRDLVPKSRFSSHPPIQFAIIGRMSLREDFRRQERSLTIEVTKSKNQDDIDRYIINRLPEVDVLREMRKLKPNGQKLANKTGAVIRARLLDGADGVFLWAKLLIDTIIHQSLKKIEMILRDPPGSLDDMIRAVFERLAHDDEIDHELLKKMLLFCIYAQRPLKFGEIDLFLSLPDLQPNLLLWKQTRGKLSSIIDLKYPPDYDSNSDDSDSDSATDEHSNDDKFDFGDKFIDNIYDEGDVFDISIERGMESLRSESSFESRTTRYLSDAKQSSEVTFCHTRIRDFLVNEGNLNHEAKISSAVIPSTYSAHVDITIACLDVLKLQLSLREDQRYLTDYPMRYLAMHLQQGKTEDISDDKYHQITEGLCWLFGTENGAKCFIMANQWYETFHSSYSSFYQDWFGDEQNLLLVQSWLRGAVARDGVCDRLNLESQIWIVAAVASYEALLRPSMMAASRLWLTRSGYDDTSYDQKGEFH